MESLDAREERSKRGAIGTWMLRVFMLPFFGFGLFAVYAGYEKWSAGDSEGIFIGVFGLLFCSFAAGFLALVSARVRQLAARESKVEQHRDRPWLANEEWAAGRIRGRGRGIVIAGWAIACVWSAVSLPAALEVPKEVARGNHAAAVALLFPLVGLGLFAMALTWTARHWRHGNTSLELQTLPGVMGGELRATLVLQRPLPRDASLRVTLRNIQRRTSGSGKNRSVSERVLWEDHVDVPATRALIRAQGCGVPLRLQIPIDTRASDPLPDSSNCTLWRLRAHAELPGADFVSEFDVPVFETPESDPSLTSASLSRKRSEGLPALETEQALASQLEVRSHPQGGVELYFPPARNKGAAATGAVIAAVFGGIAYAIADRAPLLFPSVFGGIAALVALGVTRQLLGSMSVVANAQGVRVTRRILGIGRARLVPRDAIADISIGEGMQAGSQHYWDIRLRAKPGSGVGGIAGLFGICIAPSLRERRDAERVLDRLERELRLDDAEAIATEPR